MIRSCKISIDKLVAQSLCNSTASCFTIHCATSEQVALLWQRDRATRLSVEILQLQNILFEN